MFPEDLTRHAADVFAGLSAARLRVATAESCTGGLIAGLLTEFPGASEVLERGFVTYSNTAKSEMLGIDRALISQFGAVSREVALAMAEGALRMSRADLSVAVTGVAGPGGGTADKPVGLVHIAAVRRSTATLHRGTLLRRATLHRECRFGDKSRTAIRQLTIAAALSLLQQAAALSPP